MAFKPKRTGGNGNNEGREFIDYSKIPVPKAGSRKARISLIVDLGIQEREDFVDPKTQEATPQKPCEQVAVFADLVADNVDYGGDIGKQQYRLMLNKSFKGEFQGINFNTVPPRDADGNRLEGKPWILHPANLLTKLAKTVGKPEIAVDDRDNPDSLDISLLLNQPFMAQVEVKETESDKEDKDGNKIVYRNVNYKGASAIPMVTDPDDEDNEIPMEIAPLKAEPLCITFDDAKPEHIKFLRGAVLKKIKLAKNYAGSQMQKAVEAYEAANGKSGGDEGEDAPAEKPASKPKAAKPAKPAAAKKPQPIPEPDEMDDDIPF